jgi:two-component system, cell cycle response regulator
LTVPELVPLADRLAALQAVRLALAALVVAVAVFAGAVVGEPGRAVVLLSMAYAGATAIAEAVRRRLRRRALTVVWWSLLLDGLYLAAVISETGGVGSHLLFLVHVHVVAAALLVSFRSGLTVSAWHALLLVIADRTPSIGGGAADGGSLALLAASFVLVGAGAVLAAHVNEAVLRRSRRDLGDLVDLGRDLEGCLTVDEVAAVAVAHLRDRLGFARAAVLVRVADGWTGASDAGRGPVYVSCPDVDDAIVAGAIGCGSPSLVAETEHAGAPLLSSVLPDAANVVVVPLVAEREPLGILAVECGPARDELAPSELAVLVQSAANVTLSARTAQLVTEVESLAVTDPLTGVANRRSFDETLEREVARSNRSGSPLALALLDIDHFKAVNDGLGHQVGDEVLRQVGAALRDAARQESVVARYGGEEFVVLLPDTFPEGAVLAAERLRRAVAERVDAVPVTLSAGVAVVPVNAVTARDLVAAADVALYRAKAQGRDRTVRAVAVTVGAAS